MNTRDGKGNSLERIHPQGDAHAGAVGEEGSQGCLFKEAEDQDLVPKVLEKGKKKV